MKKEKKDLKLIAVIPARGGSTRIPRKNIKDFMGKPIIAYSIEAARKSGIFTDVVVSTDDEEIAEISRHYGASVPFLRSAETSGNSAPMHLAVRETLKRYKEEGLAPEGGFDWQVMIYATAPFITPQKLREALDTVYRSEYRDLHSVTPFEFPPQLGCYVDEKHRMIPVDPASKKMRVQDLQPRYYPSGQFIFWLTDTTPLKPDRLTGRVGYVVPQEEAQDIDDENDWRLAEVKYVRMLERMREDRQ